MEEVRKPPLTEDLFIHGRFLYIMNESVQGGILMWDYREWKHVFKLDPNKEMTDEQLGQICESGTDAIIVGGTDGVTLDNTLDLLARIRRYTVSVALEVSTIEAVTPGFDLYLIPTVLNSKNPQWITQLHHQALKEYGGVMNFDEIVSEGYCVVNPDSKVAKLTEANTDLDEDDIVSYAQLASKIFRLPIFYLEYSGMYGDVSVVEKVSRELGDETIFIYGGGIDCAKKAKEMAQFADMIVVGNSIYENINQALETVKAVKKMNE